MKAYPVAVKEILTRVASKVKHPPMPMKNGRQNSHDYMPVLEGDVNALDPVHFLLQQWNLKAYCRCLLHACECVIQSDTQKSGSNIYVVMQLLLERAQNFNIATASGLSQIWWEPGLTEWKI
jgi:hypothetical protein